MVQSSVTITLADNVENLALTGTSALNGTGNALANTLTGNTAANLLNGGAGNDTLIGEGGNDTYVVDSALDVVTELVGQGTDLVQSSVTITLADNVETLILTGTANIDGAGNDDANTVTGNAGNNLLRGVLGSDTLYGGNGQDSLYGGIDNDVLHGEAGDDSLQGGVGSDTLIGGSGNDTYVVDSALDVVTEDSGQGTDLVQSSVTITLADHVETLILTGTSALNGTGNALANTLTGNAGANTLSGGAGNDSLVGNAGNDNLTGGAGTDTLVGGTGNDTYTIDDSTDVVTEQSGEGTDTVQTASSFTLSGNIENLILTGSSAINGTGDAGNNALTGNTAANLLDGGAGDDILVGGAGNDTYVIDSASDVITEQNSEGTDTVQTSSSFTLSGNIENLTLSGSNDIDGTGDNGANLIEGNSGDNALDGSAGNDTLNGNAGDDTLTGGTGNDSLSGGAGSNTLSGDAGNDTLTGSDGNDSLSGGVGDDSLTGGAGNDTYEVDSASDTLVEGASAGTDLVEASLNWTLGSHIEHLSLIGTANSNATGNALNNKIIGNDGDNVLNGDTGTDTLRGAGGNDTYVIDANDSIIENTNAGTDEVQYGANYTLGENLENLVLLGSANINGTGNALNNQITGNAGDNTLTGGDGNDIYVVNSVNDVVVELAGEGTDEIKSSINWSLNTSSHNYDTVIENLTLTGETSLNGEGNALDNLITGSSGTSDTLTGHAGNDTYVVNATTDVVVEVDGEGTDEVRTYANWTLDGFTENLTLTGSTAGLVGTGNSGANRMSEGDHTGTSTLAGGDGNDSYIISTTNCTAQENSGQGTDTVLTSVSWTLGNHIENLTMRENEDINATGNSLDNGITGNEGDNIINGLGGADTVYGGQGNDTVTLTVEGGQADLSLGTDVLNLTLGSGTVSAVDLVFGRGNGSETVDISAISSHTAGQALVNIKLGSSLTTGDIEFVTHNNAVALHITGTSDYVHLTGSGNSFDWITVDFASDPDWTTSEVDAMI